MVQLPKMGKNAVSRVPGGLDRGAGAEAPLGERAMVVGRMLIDAGQEFLGALKAPVRTSTDLVKAAGVNKDVAGRFLAAMGKRDPLAVVYYMPGVESLRRLSRGARSRSPNPVAINAFDEAIATFEQFLEDEIGGRHALDAMASAWLPEARERFESASRQMVFRAAANLRGVECEAEVSTLMLHPSGEPDRFDGVELFGLVGLRRLRPSVPLPLMTHQLMDNVADRRMLSVDGRTLDGRDDADVLLPRFGRGDPLAVRASRAGSSVTYQLVGEGLGAERASDVFTGRFIPAYHSRWATKGAPYAGTCVVPDVPTRRLVADVLLHPDVWPSRDPELMFYETAGRGMASPNDASRDADRLDLLDSVRRVGSGIECCRVAEAPRYVDLLRWVCEERGWDPGCFRVYRCDSKYPVYSVQYTMAFRRDEGPDGASVHS